MSQKLKELEENILKLNEQNRSLQTKAEDEGRPMNADESAEWDKRNDEIDALYSRHEQTKAQLTSDDRAKNLGKSAKPSEMNTVKAGEPVAVTGHEGATYTFEIDASRKFKVEQGNELYERCTDKYNDTLNSYLLGQPIPESGLQASNDNKGGYLTTMQMSTNLIKFLDDEVFMRGLATVLPPLTSAVSLGVPSWDTDPGDADWTAEVPASDISEDDAARTGRRELTPHLITKLVKVSKKMLRAGVIDVGSLLTQRLGYKFAITEEKAFLTGDGAQQPLGIFTASSSGISTGQDVSSGSSTSITADSLFDAFYNLKAGYQNRATWIFHRDAVKIIRKLKDSDNQYLWQPGLANGEPQTILGRPFVTSEYAPNTFTTGQYVGIIGDFSQYYIVDALSMTIDRLGELFALKNQIGFLGSKETDGMPVLEEAFTRLITD